MVALVWIGVVLCLAGLGGLIFCILKALQARRAGLEGVEMQARLQRLVAWNLGALAVSGIGLMLVVTGVILG